MFQIRFRTPDDFFLKRPTKYRALHLPRDIARSRGLIWRRKVIIQIKTFKRYQDIKSELFCTISAKLIYCMAKTKLNYTYKFPTMTLRPLELGPIYCPVEILQITARRLKMNYSCWRHQMETFSALLAISAGNSPVPGEFPAQRPVTRSFDFFYLRLNQRLSKQSWGWWFETLPCPLWRHCNVIQYLSSYIFIYQQYTNDDSSLPLYQPWYPLTNNPLST